MATGGLDFVLHARSKSVTAPLKIPKNSAKYHYSTCPFTVNTQVRLPERREGKVLVSSNFVILYFLRILFSSEKQQPGTQVMRQRFQDF